MNRKKVEVVARIIIRRYGVDNTDYTLFTVFIMATGIGGSVPATEAPRLATDISTL